MRFFFLRRFFLKLYLWRVGHGITVGGAKLAVRWWVIDGLWALRAWRLSERVMASGWWAPPTDEKVAT
jgi:hypothetical protein